ncbi:hypothetical protein AZE42_07361 [Rhizopogon vesiculosus]|uniref:Uncharacterized protein n=1 Tax=Rhizopogon vesiculosus TaxID=180088 RepID=A0A1J8QMK0_9AGAM|nr:hypothetical protein AZE42_07361 [Rhizopogon vesiculosus]
MSTVFTQSQSHADVLYQNLERARSRMDGQFDTLQQALQQQMRERCHHEAREWQPDAAEAFLSGLDSTILAGTGFGRASHSQCRCSRPGTKVRKNGAVSNSR